MRTIEVMNNQTLADVAIQEYGSLEAWFEVAMANGKGITDDIAVRDILKIEGEPLDVEVVNFYKSRKIKPATGNFNSASTKLGGIGYMAIGIDFIVS